MDRSSHSQICRRRGFFEYVDRDHHWTECVCRPQYRSTHSRRRRQWPKWPRWPNERRRRYGGICTSCTRAFIEYARVEDPTQNEPKRYSAGIVPIPWNVFSEVSTRDLLQDISSDANLGCSVLSCKSTERSSAAAYGSRSPPRSSSKGYRSMALTRAASCV